MTTKEINDLMSLIADTAFRIGAGPSSIKWSRIIINI